MCFPRCQVKNRGYPIKQTTVIPHQAWRGIAFERVVKYTCPGCGATETSVETNGTAVTEARHAALAAL